MTETGSPMREWLPEKYHVVEIADMRRWQGRDLHDLGRVRVAEDGELEFCDCVQLTLNVPAPDPPSSADPAKE